MTNAPSVTLSEDAFYELLASSMTPATASQRVAGTVQTTIICTLLGGTFVGCCWGWAKAQDWLEQKNFDRKNANRKDANPK